MAVRSTTGHVVLSADDFEPSGDMAFNKVKYDGSRMVLEYALERGDDRQPEDLTLNSPDRPVQAFKDALQALAQDVCTICELPEQDATRIEVRSVTVTHKNGILGLCICGLKGLQTANAPLVLNTPHLTEAPYSDTGGGPLLAKGTLDRLRTLLDQAEAYVCGVREQPHLKDAESNRSMFPPDAGGDEARR